jgi:hypoxanthine phosphoribosyltransferase
MFQTKKNGASASTTSNKVVMENAMNYLVYDDLDMEGRKFVTWEQFERGIADLAQKIRSYEQQRGVTFNSIHAIPRGGLVLGVKLSYLFDLPLILDRSKVSARTLIVDDCVVTGKTLKPFEQHVIAVMFAKPGSMVEPAIVHERTAQQINFCWESKSDRN